MGFLRCTFDMVDGRYRATIVRSWMVFWEDHTEQQTFDSLDEAKEWAFRARCYNQVQITDDAQSKLSYADAVQLQKYPSKKHEELDKINQAMTKRKRKRKRNKK